MPQAEDLIVLDQEYSTLEASELMLLQALDRLKEEEVQLQQAFRVASEATLKKKTRQQQEAMTRLEAALMSPGDDEDSTTAAQKSIGVGDNVSLMTLDNVNCSTNGEAVSNDEKSLEH